MSIALCVCVCVCVCVLFHVIPTKLQFCVWDRVRVFIPTIKQFSGHQPVVLKFNSILNYLERYQIPQDKKSVLKDNPHHLQRPVDEPRWLLVFPTNWLQSCCCCCYC